MPPHTTLECHIVLVTMTHSAMTVPVLRAMLIGVIAQHVNVYMTTRIYAFSLMVRYEDEGEGARGRGEGMQPIDIDSHLMRWTCARFGQYLPSSAALGSLRVWALHVMYVQQRWLALVLRSHTAW